MALQFGLNIGPPKCCGTADKARKENSRDVDRVQREAHRADVNATDGVSDLTEGLKSLLDTINEKFEQTVEELKTVQEECNRMSEENLRMQIEQREDCKKSFAAIERRLKTLEDRGPLYWTGRFEDQKLTGTVVRYSPLIGTDVIVKRGQIQSINISSNCITLMKVYENKSLEELRMEDYAANRKGPQAGAPPGLIECGIFRGCIFGQTTGFG